MIYAGRGASSWSGGYREMKDDGESLEWIFGHGDDEAPESQRDQRLEIARIDDPTVETRMSREFAEREAPAGRKKSDAGRRTDISPTLRNDRSEEAIVEGIGAGSAADRRVSRINDVSRSARVSGSQQASINADNDLGSSIRRRARDSDDDHRDGRGDAAASADDDGGAENSRASLAEGASNLEFSSRRKIAEGGARRYSAGMQEDQLLFFRDDRERVQSSAMSPAEMISDRKDLPGERDREDPASKRRHGASRDWFTRTWSRSQNFRRRAGEIATRGIDNGARRERILEGSVKVTASNAETKRFERSIIGRHEQDSGSERYDESDAREEPPMDEEGGPQDPSSKDSNDESSDEIEADKQDFASNGANAFQIFDSVIPPDNKRRKVTRGEDSKELMIAGDFVWTSQDQSISKSLIPHNFRPISLQDALRRGSKKRARAIVEGNRELERRIDGSTIRAIGDRRKRYANYYSAQSATPMAYVHIQPAYPVLPPTNRKCTRCMVVYKPCPSPPLGIVLPSYRYHEPAIKWRGFKYGE